MQDEESLTLMEKLLHSAEKDSETEIKPLSVEELNRRIDASVSDSKNEKLTKSGDLITEIHEWK